MTLTSHKSQEERNIINDNSMDLLLEIMTLLVMTFFRGNNFTHLMIHVLNR
jgi:hypothetical protein